MATVRALGGEACGYKIGATSVEVQQLLNCRIPIYAPILREDVLPSGATFRIPAGLLGIECEFGFRMGHDFPISAKISDIAALRSAIAECFVSLEIVGRRVDTDAHAKHNASEKKPTLAYKQNVMTVGQDPHTQKPIIAPYVIWDEHSVPITADGAMAAASGREDTDQKKVKDFLRGILASSDPVPYKQIEEEAEQQGFTRKQLRTAKQKLGITSNKDGLGGPWMWQLKF